MLKDEYLSTFVRHFINISLLSTQAHPLPIGRNSYELHLKHQQDIIYCTTVGHFLFENKMFNILHHISSNCISFIILKAGATLYKLHINYDNSIEQQN